MKSISVSMMALAALLVPAGIHAGSLPPEVKAKLEVKAKQLQAWASDPVVVAAVKAYNTNPPAEAGAMTNEKWKQLTLLDPRVRSYSKNQVAQALKAKKDLSISEAFVSGSDGGKVAFLSKPSSWSHKGNEKHQVPMTGRVWYGSVEMDDSSGQQQVQIALPVLDGQRPIGSMVVGIKLTALK